MFLYNSTTQIVAGEHSLSSVSGNEQTVRVAEEHRHDGYNANTLENDCAILILSQDLIMSGIVAPVCRPSTIYHESGEAWVTGWGTLSSGKCDRWKR